jgi:3'-phosphoadenosine 5'-phosphosulfate sulfotransferase (PAPS reductase)/FAD synthetase
MKIDTAESNGSLGKLRGRRVVLSMSGGKDSAATSLYLRELGVEHDRVFADTGWEHPATYEYLRGDLTRALGPIAEVRGRYTLPDLVRKKMMFPSRRIRFCTQELKVFPLAEYVKAFDVEVVNAVGVRAAESAARAKLSEWEWSDTFDCDVWRPIIAWSEADVIAIHKRHGLAPNPLYLMGASRVGCWPCIHARKSEVRLVADVDPARIDEIRSLEAEVQEGARARYEAKGETFESMGYSPPTFFQGPIEDRKMWPIDKVVTWSRTSRGGRQLEMFTDPHGGCVRWGMCEAGPKDDATEAGGDRPVAA